VIPRYDLQPFPKAGAQLGGQGRLLVALVVDFAMELLDLEADHPQHLPGRGLDHLELSQVLLQFAGGPIQLLGELPQDREVV
jgi:hypothetical protein